MTFDFERTLTQQGRPQGLPACPRTKPEAKLIAPALLPAQIFFARSFRVALIVSEKNWK
jgi:hypothetical protein